MNLKIEGGQLLMPYAAPYSRKEKQHRKPKGWTPDRTPAMQTEFDILKAEYPTTPDYMLWEQIETAESEQMTGKPWPGWTPIVYAKGGVDKDIGNAYRELYLQMNGEYADLLARGVPLEGRTAEWPSDGDYVFERGVMLAANEKIREG